MFRPRFPPDVLMGLALIVSVLSPYIVARLKGYSPLMFGRAVAFARGSVLFSYSIGIVR